jgi:N-terminal acetyltransferase B complex non-catalytic subunit
VKAFPKERKYFFWRIFAYSLLAVSPQTTEQGKKLYGTLAYKMLSQTVANSSNDAVPALRTIQSLEEIKLLLEVYRIQGEDGAALKVLESDTIGTESKIAHSDWGLVREKMRLLASLNQWRSLWTYCKNLLEASYQTLTSTDSSSSVTGGGVIRKLERSDDHETWSRLLQACFEIEEYGLTAPKGSKQTLLTLVY